MKPRSLRRRLILVSSGFVALIWLLAVVVVALNLSRFLDTLVDAELARDMRLASHLLDIVRPNVEASVGALEVLFQDVGMISGLQGEWGFRSYLGDGRVIIESTHLPEFPLPAAEGFADLQLEGEPWRILARRLDDNIWAVLAANKSGANALILDNLQPALWLLLLVLPLTIAAVVIGIHRGTRPVVELAGVVRERSPRSLEPLDYAEVPVEVQPLVDALNQLLARVRKLVDHEHRFVADAAHELQTPLAAMKTELQNCIAQTGDTELADTLRRLEQRVNRSVHSVKQLLTLARLDPEVPLPRTDTVNLEHVVYDTLAAHGDDLLRQGLDCQVRGDAPPLRGCNEELVLIAVRNLLENAVKYASPNSSVQIDLVPAAGGVTLRVANDCAPLPPGTLERLRDSFFRVPGNAATGAGLGLAIVDRIAALHGGGIEIGPRAQGAGLAVNASFRHGDDACAA